MAYPNITHIDKFQFSFSNIPNLEDTKVPMRIFDEYVRNLTIPSIQLEVINLDFKGSTTRQPISRENSDVNIIVVEFFATEDMENYNYLYQYAQMLKFRKSTTEKLKDTVISTIDVNVLDNQKRKKKTFRFENVYIGELGSMQFDMSTSDQLSFYCTFTYDVMNFIKH
jgi:hypothetical protein